MKSQASRALFNRYRMQKYRSMKYSLHSRSLVKSNKAKYQSQNIKCKFNSNSDEENASVSPKSRSESEDGPHDAVVELVPADGTVGVPLEVVEEEVPGQHLLRQEDGVAPAALHQSRRLPLLALPLQDGSQLVECLKISS